jgi:hypothetical protein
MNSGSDDVGRFRSERRAQTYLVGVVLLLGIVLVGSILTLAVGAMALDDLQRATDLRTGEYAMREVDSRLSQISAGRTKVQLLDFGAEERNVEVTTGSYLNLTVNADESCRVHVPMGAMIERNDRGQVIAYEGGGVWRRHGDASVLVSPPDFQYEQGTINFPVVSMDGGLEGQVTRLRAVRNNTKSRERRLEIRETLDQDACRTPLNLTVRVRSEFYDGWGRYLERKTGVEPTYHHGNETVDVTIERVGELTDDVDVDDESGTLSAEGDLVAEVEILGSEGTVTADGSEWDGDDGNGDPKVELNDPYRFQLRVNGEIRTPWKDGALDDDVELYDDNVNDPRDDLPSPVTVVLGDGDTFGVEAAILNCGPGGQYRSQDWEYTGIDEVNDGTTYLQHRCTRPPDTVENDVQVEIIATPGGTGTNNLVILSETQDRLEGSFEQKKYQRNLNEILGDDIDACGDDRCVDLDTGQYLFVYELSRYLGDGETDDFNDGVVLVTFREVGNVGSDTNFAITITTSFIEISKQ